MSKVVVQMYLTELYSGENPRGPKRDATEITLRGGMSEESETTIREMFETGSMVTITLEKPDSA